MTTTSLFVNRATAKLAVGVVAGDTALTLVAGSGVFFPAPAAGEFFRLVLQKGTGQTDLREYMICTSRTGDVLTVTRGQEGTPPAVFDPGDELSQVITAATATSFAQKVGAQLQGALTVEADPTVALGIATKQFVESGRVNDAPADGKDYARKDTAWHALGAAAGLAVPIPISAGGTGGATLPAAQTNLVIGVTTIDDNPPATPKYGDRWIRPGNMTEMVWVPNAGGGGAGVWINPQDAQSEAYPIAVSKGGTGATTAAQALVNLGGTTVGVGVFTAATQAAGRTALGIVDYTTTAFKLFDGTVAAPGLAWASEPGLGWFRAGPSVVGVASNGLQVSTFDTSASTLTVLGLNPRAAGAGQISLANAPYGSANFNILQVGVNTFAHYLQEAKAGTAPAKALYFTFPAGVSVSSNLSVANPTASTYLIISKAASANEGGVLGQMAGKNRWLLDVAGNATVESGSNAGSDFVVSRYDDTGAYGLDQPHSASSVRERTGPVPQRGWRLDAGCQRTQRRRSIDSGRRDDATHYALGDRQLRCGHGHGDVLGWRQSQLPLHGQRQSRRVGVAVGALDWTTELAQLGRRSSRHHRPERQFLRHVGATDGRLRWHQQLGDSRAHHLQPQ